MFADQISDMIEEEVQRRLEAYIKIFAEHFFTSETELRKIVSSGKTVEYCAGKSKNGKCCKNKGKYDGYCHLHKHQKKNKKKVAREETSCSVNNEQQIRSAAGIVDEIF